MGAILGTITGEAQMAVATREGTEFSLVRKLIWEKEEKQGHQLSLGNKSEHHSWNWRSGFRFAEISASCSQILKKQNPQEKEISRLLISD